MKQSSLRIGEMLIGYYRLCPRKAWWSLRGIAMEQESDAVALGRLLDESSYARSNKHLEIEAEAPDGTPLVGKIDRANLKHGVLHETKKVVRVKTRTVGNSGFTFGCYIEMG